MEIKASLNYLRISPRKARLAADSIRGMQVERAQNQLTFLNKKSAGPVLKLLNSAIANGEHNFKLDKATLYVKSIAVNQGSVLKRWMPRAFGRASPIAKKTSHIDIVLESKSAAKKDKIVKEVKKSEEVLASATQEKSGASGEKSVKPKFEIVKKLGGKRLGAARKIFQRKSI